MEDNEYYLSIENDIQFDEKQEDAQERTIRICPFLRYVLWVSWSFLTSVIISCIFRFIYRNLAVREGSVFTKTIVSILLIIVMISLMVYIYRILDSCITKCLKKKSLKKTAAVKDYIEQVNGIQENITKKESSVTVDWNGKVHGVYISDGAPSHWEIPVNTNHTYLTFSEDHHKNTVIIRFENYGNPYLDRSVHILCPYSLYNRYQNRESLTFVKGKLIK